MAFGSSTVLINLACDTGVALIFYQLLKPVSSSISGLAAFFRLIMVAILGVNLLNHFAPLVLLKGAPYLSVFNMDQLQSLALASVRLYSQGFTIALVFFGIHCVLIGYFSWRSTFLPRILGMLMAIAGLCYLTNSFAVFLAPAFAHLLFPRILLPAFPAELGLTLWLIVKGINVQRWNEQASASFSLGA